MRINPIMQNANFGGTIRVDRIDEGRPRTISLDTDKILKIKRDWSSYSLVLVQDEKTDTYKSYSVMSDVNTLLNAYNAAKTSPMMHVDLTI
ncbi:MAG: hypothetical protein NC191_07675 [Muribaculaceae bacterium]|nr:hypothetical protein [Muribaculaceae bacterium]